MAWPQHLTTHLGNKGYVLLKRELTREQEETLKQQLMVAPFVPGAPPQCKPPRFPVYRESQQKLYVPRFFGERLFGPPKQHRVTEGDDVALTFNGALKENQVDVVQAYLSHVEHGGSGLLELYCGWGKCLAKNTEVLLFNGAVQLVQNIAVGDLLMGDDSTPRRVLSLACGRERMYRVTNLRCPTESYVVNESHILSLKRVSPSFKEATVVEMDVLHYLSLPQEEQQALQGYKVAVAFPTAPLLPGMDPYREGRELRLPVQCLINDRPTRLQLLAGWIESLGFYHEHTRSFTMRVPAFDVPKMLFLARSLGFTCYAHNQAVCLSGPLTDIPLPDFWVEPTDDGLCYPIAVEALEPDTYYGFCLDGNRRFVLGDFSVTHNTDATVYIMAQLRKKTLVVVHKEFLMNQWIERIHKYCPEARIGRIQGSVVDIADKDVVIAMLQSLSMKDYPVSLFDSFGFAVFDEVHHMSCEVFSGALFKLVTHRMLGLSATMNRRDRTTHVFKMFLGEVVAKRTRAKDEHVVVRGITFKSTDEEFNTVETDFRGQIASAKMLSKLYFNPRSQFILQVLRDMLAENPAQQIMIISSYKNLLAYMHTAITHHNLCSVGYYVGGMKEKQLKESESKQVVLATYAMAAEGLDIKTLTTLFMISPMTNIEQAVGRILRQTHAFAPIVVDIIDTHDNFRRQWAKRRQFYKAQNYTILETDSNRYLTNPSSRWKTTFAPKLGKRKGDEEEGDEEGEEEKEEEKERKKRKGNQEEGDEEEGEDDEDEEDEDDPKPKVGQLLLRLPLKKNNVVL